METAIIAAIPSIIQGITALVSYIQSVRTAAQQNNVWTPDMETSYQSMLASAATAPEWQPDSVPAAQPVAPVQFPAPVNTNIS